MKTRTAAIWPVLPPTTSIQYPTTLALFKFFSSDHIVIWSICSLCSFSCFCTSRFQIADPADIRSVAIRHWHVSCEVCRFLTVIQQILVGSPSFKREVIELLTTHNLGMDHVTMQSEPRNWLWAQVVEPVIWNLSPVPTGPESQGVMSGAGEAPRRVTRSGSYVIPAPDGGIKFWSNKYCSRGSQNGCQHYW